MPDRATKIELFDQFARIAQALASGRRVEIVDELAQRLRELPRDREIVAYCRGPYCAFAPEAVRMLREHGYAARHLSEGLPEWAAAGNGVASAPADPIAAPMRRPVDRMTVRNN